MDLRGVQHYPAKSTKMIARMEVQKYYAANNYLRIKNISITL